MTQRICHERHATQHHEAAHEAVEKTNQYTGHQSPLHEGVLEGFK
jgi:hypothetical protein